MDVNVYVGQQIRKFRLQKGMTQKELGLKVGVKHNTISSYEKGINEPEQSIIFSIANALDVNIDDLFPSTSDLRLKLNQPTFIPLVGTVCAGNGLLADHNIEDYVCYPYPKKRQPDFALHVKGNSMKNAGINDGDIVYMRKSSWAEYNGQIVAAVINDGDGMLKRIKWTEGSNVIQLLPENDDFQIINVLPTEIIICGVYMGHFNQE